MKKLWICIALLCLCLTACGSEPEPTTAPTQIDASTEATQPLTKTVCVRTSSTTQSGSTVTRTEYLFDDQDRVTEVLVYTNDVQTQRHSVECDEHGNYILWSSDVSQIRYTYDSEGHLLGYFAYTGDTLVSSTEYTWNEGLRTSITRRMPSQTLEHRTTLTYDESGSLIRQDSYLNGTLLDYSVYSIGEDGKPTAMTTYHADGTLSKTVTYVYDGLTVTATADDGTVTQQTFDEHGDLLSSIEYAADGTETSRETHSWKAIEVPIDSPRASI